MINCAADAKGKFKRIGIVVGSVKKLFDTVGVNAEEVQAEREAVRLHQSLDQLGKVIYLLSQAIFHFSYFSLFGVDHTCIIQVQGNYLSVAFKRQLESYFSYLYPTLLINIQASMTHWQVLWRGNPPE